MNDQTRYRFDGCSGVPDRILGVDLWLVCAEHDGMDVRWFNGSGQQKPRPGPSYVNGGPWRAKAGIDASFAWRVFATALEEAPFEGWRYSLLIMPWTAIWIAVALLAFAGVSAFGLAWAPPLHRLSGAMDWRWGRVDPTSPPSGASSD